MISDTYISGVTESPARDVRPIVWWLLILAAMTFFMVMLGGYTRLSESGLSMVEWRPVTGWLPPLSEAAWQEEFVKYQAFPQYQQLNRDMSLEEFQAIYWPEYLHRLFGRIMGLAFALPFAWFALTRRLPKGWGFKLAGLFALGAAQGAMGWFMVKSGLVDVPAVSHYRLTAHLGLAVLLYGLLLSMAWRLGVGASPLPWGGLALLALLYVQILLGGLVAGLDAGLIHNTWPSMDGEVLPATAFELSPLWLNFFDNPSLVQFQHRMLSYLVCVVVAVYAFKAIASGAARAGGFALLLALILQMALGIATVLQAAPLGLAVLHQGGALVLFTAALYALHAAAGRRS